MNRRQFFGMTVAAVVAAGLPLSVLPEKTIFLPPRGGLWTPLRIREVEQYIINNDSLAMRWDVAWELNGERGQAYSTVSPLSGLEYTAMSEAERLKYREWHREMARQHLARFIPAGAKPFPPKLPNGLVYAAHV